LIPAPCHKRIKMTDQQEFDTLIAGLPAKAERLFPHFTPDHRQDWVTHVTTQARYYREHLDLRRALEYLRA
jgi:hypothetical protein